MNDISTANSLRNGGAAYRRSLPAFEIKTFSWCKVLVLGCRHASVELVIKNFGALSIPLQLSDPIPGMLRNTLSEKGRIFRIHVPLTRYAGWYDLVVTTDSIHAFVNSLQAIWKQVKAVPLTPPSASYRTCDR
jgi:hypothetical protein